MIPSNALFPFGLFSVNHHEEACRRYAEVIPDLALAHPLPLALPRRHPVLAALEGTYAVQDQLPPWWFDCITMLAQRCPCLEPLFRSVSREEFRRGSLDPARWKSWRKHQRCQFSTENAPQQPCWREQGSGLYWLLAEVLLSEERELWLDRFVGRGDKDTPLDLDLVITADPQWWLNMSNGRGWYSCMGNGSDRDPRIVGNWYDTGVLLAALVARGTDCWTLACLIARTTIRLVWEGSSAWDEAGRVLLMPSAPRIVIGRLYHNDLTSACHLLITLATLCEQRGLTWGCIAATNTVHLVRDGSLGAVAFDETTHSAIGTAFWRPMEVDEPYLDGEASYRERAEREQEGIWAYPLLSAYACRLPTALASQASRHIPSLKNA
jgi:hypothetical protein